MTALLKLRRESPTAATLFSLVRIDGGICEQEATETRHEEREKRSLPRVNEYFPATNNAVSVAYRSQIGVTMIELMVVIGLIAFIYSIAVPQFSMRTGSEAATKVTRLTDDIRSAFDMAVLNNKPYRIVFTLATGKYILEESEGDVWIGDSKTPKDPTEEEEKNLKSDFDAKTKEMESAAGDKVKDADGKEIDGSNMSPILKHRSKAQPPKWVKVENLEWTDRSLGDFLLISEMQAEHHPVKQIMTELGMQGRAFLYFMPQGYVEKAYIRVAFKTDDMVVDEDKKPYTIVTKPFTGGADVSAGIVEVDVHDLSEGEDGI